MGALHHGATAGPPAAMAANRLAGSTPTAAPPPGMTRIGRNPAGRGRGNDPAPGCGWCGADRGLQFRAIQSNGRTGCMGERRRRRYVNVIRLHVSIWLLAGGLGATTAAFGQTPSFAVPIAQCPVADPSAL